MSVIIKKAGAPIVVKQITWLIVGQPGVGKTTIGNTADNPILLDFDGFSYRAKNTKDKIEISTWSDASGLTASDIVGYDTIVIDTVGKCLDYIAADIIETDKKDHKYTKSDGMLSISGFGRLKSIFVSWIRQLTIMRKDIVLIAHDKEKGEDDKLYIRAEVTGGSYQEITRISDAIGYLYHEDVPGKDKIIILNCTPCKKWLGKNPGEFEPMQIPHYLKEPNFLGNKIREIKEKLTVKSTQSIEDEKKISEFMLRIKAATNAAEINLIYNDILVNLAETDVILKTQLKAVLIDRAKEINIKWDKDIKGYVDLTPPTAEPKPPTETPKPETPQEQKQEPQTEKKNGTPPPVQPTETKPPEVKQPEPEAKPPVPEPEAKLKEPVVEDDVPNFD